jgi:hypothetical protein
MAGWLRKDTLSGELEELRNAQKRSRIFAWRNKAEELRVIADGMKDIGSRRLMLNASANFQRLADEAEERDNAIAHASF